MSRRVFYDPETGRGICSTSQKAEFYPDWVDTELGMDLHYYPGGVPTLRTEMTPTITGNDPATVGQPVSFTGFPIDSHMRIDGSSYTLTDGAINFTPTTIGDYSIEVVHVANITYRMAIHAS
jgi:hypothetical protein